MALLSIVLVERVFWASVGMAVRRVMKSGRYMLWEGGHRVVKVGSSGI